MTHRPRLAVLIRSACAAMLLAQIVFAFNTFALAASLYVGTEAGDYPTIQAALDAAGVGDRVILRAGTYVEDIVIDTPGIQIVPEFGAEAILDGSITMTHRAGGSVVTHIQLSEGNSIFVEDGIEWPASLAEGTENRVITLAGGDNSYNVTLEDVLADVSLSSVAGVFIFAEGENSTVTHTGAIDVKNSGFASTARGASISTGDGGIANIEHVDVEAGGIAIGLHFFTGDGGQLAMTGDLVTRARDNGSAASGFAIRGETGVSATSEGVEVEGGGYAVGVDFNVADGGVLTHSGDIDVKARDEGSAAYGVALGAGDGSSVTIGSVAVEGGALARGVTTTYSSGTIVVTDGLKDDVHVHVVGDLVKVLARDEDSQAYGVDLQADNNLVLTVGNVEVEGGALARGVWLQATGDGGSLTQAGSVDVTAREADADAHGIIVWAGNNFALTAEDRVTVGAGDMVRAVHYRVGDSGRLALEGDVAATSAAGAATGLRVEAGASFESVIDNVSAHGVTNAIGVSAQVGNGGTLTQTGTILSVATGDNVSTRGMEMTVGDGFALTLENVVVTSVGDASTGLGVFGTFGEDFIGNLSDVAVTAQRTTWGVSLRGEDRAVIQVGSVTTISEGAESDAYGVQFTGTDALSVTLGEVVSRADQAVWAVTVKADEGLTLDVDTVTAQAGMFAYGIDVAGENSTVTVRGDVTAKTTGGVGIARALSFQSAVIDVTNEGHVQAAANNATGIGFGQPSAAERIVFHNKGVVETSGTAGAAVAINVTEAATVQNDGAIDAGTGVAFQAINSVGAIALSNTGTILGSVQMGRGADVLDVSETGHIVGRVSMGEGADRVVLERGASVEGDVDLGAGDDEATIHYGAVLAGMLDGGAGDDTLTLLGESVSSLPEGATWSRISARRIDQTSVLGGAWQWGAGTNVGRVDVHDAYLRIDDHITVAELQLHDGALIGDGHVTGNVANEGGIVSPGNSFGILTITGNYTQGADGVLYIELDASAAPQAGVNYDQLVIVGGTAVFEDGTTVRVRPTVGPALPERAEYVLVDGDVIFDPDAIRFEIEFPRRLFYGAWLEQGSMKLILGVIAYDTVAETENQAAVARALDEARGTPDTDLDELYDWLAGLDPDEAEAAAAAFESLSGEVYSHLPTLAARRFDNVVGAVALGIPHPGAESLWRVWAIPYTDAGRVAAEPGTAASHFWLSGVVAGAELFTGPNARVGLSIGAGAEQLTMGDRSGHLQGHGHQIGLYGHFVAGETRLTALLGYGSTTYQSGRDVGFGDVHREAKAAFTVTDWTASAEARFRAPNLEAIRIEPVIALGYFSTSHPSFAEQGADTVGLIVDGREVGVWRGRAALEMTSDPWEFGLGWVHPRVSFAWVYDFSPAERMQTGRLQGAAEHPFAIRGTKAHQSGFEAAFGLRSEEVRGWMWSLDYTGAFRKDMSNHLVMARIMFGF